MSLHIEDTGGNGQPVILVHGWPLSAEAWEYQVPALNQAGHRVIAYDRRGFGRSTAPDDKYDYDTLAADLEEIIKEKNLNDVTLVGFSMGGGEVARFIGNHGEARLKSVVFAAAVPPCLMQSDDNPDGPLTEDAAQEFEDTLKADRDAFFDGFTKDFFSADGDLKVTEEQRLQALDLCNQSSPDAALGCMRAWATTDFRNDLEKITVPTLVLHGTADGIVPIEGSGHRTHKMVAHSNLCEIEGAPHGCNTSHVQDFNAGILDFLGKH
ncbi:Non-heme bromoperoxidase BPO-A2 [Roseovarius sp. THAF9]|uniref:alpha/beta fold hydrolase n=1 Tax=Roseovarius sp. THAF9 TaxID=2587847 RepID=UPI00126884DD|nr:alpha/beta hydrolase [Roseovarius sp. THAF9]QFT94961.1 Non-heme bromoperoxidase BPO-A2 [Roseovarius sp. THAF9]